MTYSVAPALQSAVYTLLTGDAGLTALVGSAIYDAVPPGVISGTYVALGPETVREAGDATKPGALHELDVSVITDDAGFAGAKDVASVISDALTDASLTLSRGHLVYLTFHRATARRVQDADMRRIDLRFRARVEDD